MTVFPCATRDTKETHADRAKPKGYEFVGEREMVFSSVDGKDPVSIHRVNPSNCIQMMTCSTLVPS